MRDHIRSNVVGYLALFVALSGTAVALPNTNTVDSGDIINGQVKSKDIGTGQVRSLDVADDSTGFALTGGDIAAGTLTGSDLANGSIDGTDVGDNSLTGTNVANSSLTGTDVANNSLNGADIDEGAMGQVPDAARAVLGGYGRSFSGNGCDPTGATYIDCGFVTLSLPSQTRVLLIGATRGYLGGFGFCRLVTSAGVLAGTEVGVNSQDAVSLTTVTGPLGGGTVDFGIECKQTTSDIAYEEVRLSAVALAPN